MRAKKITVPPAHIWAEEQEFKMEILRREHRFGDRQLLGTVSVQKLFSKARTTVTSTAARHPEVVIFKRGDSNLIRLSALIERWGQPPSDLYEPMLTAATTTWIGEQWTTRDGGWLILDDQKKITHA